MKSSYSEKKIGDFQEKNLWWSTFSTTFTSPKGAHLQLYKMNTTSLILEQVQDCYFVEQLRLVDIPEEFDFFAQCKNNKNNTEILKAVAKGVLVLSLYSPEL